MACKRFENGKECPLETYCNKTQKGRQCKFPLAHRSLERGAGDTDLVIKIKRKMRPKFMKGWREALSSGKSGEKLMTGGAFEKALRDVFKEGLADLGVNVWSPNKRLYFTKYLYIVPDCYIAKKGYPTTIISAKTGFGAEQVRETFAYAYFAKQYLRKERIRVYMAMFLRHKTLSNSNKDLIKACKRYVKGIYWLSNKGDIDNLFNTIRKTYS